MDLGFDITDLVPDRTPQPLEVEFVRYLRDADLELAERGEVVPSLQRVSERHHALARNLALGMEPDLAAGLIGYATGTAYRLASTPAFQDLIALYRRELDMEYAELGDQLKGVSKDALLILRERIESTPEDFSNGMLLDILKATADRSGYGPSSTQKTETTISVVLADRLEASRKRAREQLPHMRDVTPKDA